MDVVKQWSAPNPARAVDFSGHWKEFLPIAVSNLLLTVITLGIYRFWAKARERRYLWSRTRLIDADLEWTGTGGEMFVGFLIAMGVLIGWTVAIVAGGLLLGDWFMVVGMIGFYLFVAWAFGFAQFRALRYRLSRTYWRGIRGGSDNNGVSYGWTALGNNIIAALTMGILTPRAIVENWKDRVRAMSFGPHMLESDVDTDGLQLRWMLVYPIYIGFVVLTFIGTPDPDTGEQASDALVLTSLLLLLVGLPLVMVSFWALFFRKAAQGFEMGELRAGFEVSTAEWLKFYARLIGLTLVTLGFGAIMWGYLRWKFVFDRLELYGVVDLDTMTQSETSAVRDAEGFADAFDIGAF